MLVTQESRNPRRGAPVHDTVGLTALQLALLRVLWDRGEASTCDVWKALATEQRLALTTVATLLGRLERKGFVVHWQVGRRYVYRALVTRADVRRSKVRHLTSTLFGGDPVALVRHLVRDEGVDDSELVRIRLLLTDVKVVGPGTDV